MLGRILRLPANTLSGADIQSLQYWGSYKFKSFVALNLASLMRAAHATLRSWPAMHAMLRDSAIKYKKSKHIFSQRSFNISPNWWCTDAIVSVLHSAYFGFEAHEEFRELGTSALHALRIALKELDVFVQLPVRFNFKL